ncbi:5232_t:CDS:1 [Diversispora eburnea]|uniref:5232_t:CDS:1 n=1 Tax=Diversispora eburnea TaxID=1213867 RepID=A0A9N9AV63_9GLOM|nr:5232_t:CDS:1 [Diversispora eburnea]
MRAITTINNRINSTTTNFKPFTTASTSSTKPNQSTPFILVKHHLCKPCKAQIGINLTHPFERSAFLHSLLNDNGLTNSNHERMVHDYVDKGIGNPMAIVKYLIEKRWFFDHTGYGSLEADNQSIPEKDRRMLALQMWVRNRIDNGNILSPRNDSEHEGRAPASLWPTIDQILYDLLASDMISPSNQPDYIEINSDNGDSRPVILIND